MIKKTNFDNNFSFASKDMFFKDIIDNDNNYLLFHHNMRDIKSGRTDNIIPKIECNKENQIIKEQSEQTLTLLNIINLYQQEYEKNVKEQKLYSFTNNKSYNLQKLINILIIIFILILIIIMSYIHKL